VTAPVHLESASGLRAEWNANGSLRRIDHGTLMLNLFPGNELEGGPANLYLRRRGARSEATPLLGPRSPARTGQRARAFVAAGEWREIRFRVSFTLAQDAPAWFWHVELENTGAAVLELDLIHAQDLALADYGFLRNNEFYASHYVDYTPLVHARHGCALAVRQNLAMGGRHPWALVGSLGRASGFATDALEFYGLSVRGGGQPVALAAATLPNRRRQHEHSLAVLQEEPFSLAPGARVSRGFFAWFEASHESASGEADLAFVDRALALREAAPPAIGPVDAPEQSPAPTLFSASPLLACRELREDELAPLFGDDLREIERDGARVLSAFGAGTRHVVLRAKELASLRPHAHLLRTGDRLLPDEASLTTTAWMGGVFHSLLTQGHVGINRFLSAQRGYLGLFRSHGQRVFAELAGVWHLLDVPSAWEVEPSACRWIYRHARGEIEVCVRAPLARHELDLRIAVRAGEPCRFLVSHHVAVAGDDGALRGSVRFERGASGISVSLPPDSDLGRRFPNGAFRVAPAADTELERVGGDELLFLDGRSHGEPLLALVTAASRAIELRITGELVADSARAERAPEAEERTRAQRFWSELSGPLALIPAARSPLAAETARLAQIVPWFAHDAWIHYLAPRGIEQFSGGGWGTRDVCQGPVEWLLALGRSEPLRKLLLIVFRAQNPDGDWPQWFMFFERERNIRPADSHGDIVFWPLVALARYLIATEDASILAEELPFFDAAGEPRAERATLWAHVQRALALTQRRVIPGTRLAAYGHGDWNDSLQPADPALREQLCSAWTVGLHVEMLGLLARGLRRIGRAADAAPCDALAEQIRADFQRLLIADGALAGYAYFHRDGRVEHWMHPSDQTTGIRVSLIAILQAIASGLLTPEQVAAHRAQIREHLLAPDGARLFDAPTRYRGGPEHLFQRAESSACFGREIALLYTHAHLRYAEAMARCGDGEALFTALLQANPIAIRERVASARLRQAFSYTTSVDADFLDRYEAATRYREVMAGRVPLEGGWRVYSSGPGIYLRLVHECLLGVRRGRARLVIDPVLPRALDGLRAQVEVNGIPLELVYRIRSRGHGPSALALDGRPLAFEREANPYRAGGAEIPSSALGPPGARRELVVELG
jgi:1,2-beta-oligoglucan phosphorylase